MPSTWWVIRSAFGVLAGALHVDRKGLVVKWSEDEAKALRLPTKRCAAALRRALGAAELDVGLGARLIRVTRRTVHRLPAPAEANP